MVVATSIHVEQGRGMQTGSCCTARPPLRFLPFHKDSMSMGNYPRLLKISVAALFLATIVGPAFSGENDFDRNLSPRYLVLEKSYTRDPHASHKMWDYYLSSPVYYPGAAKCKGNGYSEFRTAAEKKYVAEVNSTYGEKTSSSLDESVTSRDDKGIYIGDGWSGPLLTKEDAEGFTQRYVAHLSKLDAEYTYGEHAVDHIDFRFDCSSLAAAAVPATPAKATPVTPQAPTTTIIVTDTSAEAIAQEKREKEEAARQAAEAEQARKDAAARDILAQAGAQRTAENEARARELQNLRDRIEKQQPKMCQEPGRSYEYDFSLGSPAPMADMKARYASAQSQRGLYCNGPRMQLGPLQCATTLKVMGDELGKCTATVTCAAWEHPCGGSARSE